MDPMNIGKLNFLGLTRNVNPIAQPPAEGGAGVGRKPQSNPEIEAAVSSINCEITPKYLDTAASGSTFTYGVGPSNFSAFKPYLA